MKKQITQVLQKFNFEEGLCIFRKAGGSEFWANELEDETDRDYATQKLKELLQRILSTVEDKTPEEENKVFENPEKIKEYKKLVNNCYAVLRTSHAKIKSSESVQERKELAFTILSTVAQINEYMNIIRFWQRTGKLVEKEAEIIDLKPKKKEFKSKPLPTTQIGLYREKKNLESYLSPTRIEERNTPKDKVEFWKERLGKIELELKKI